MSDQEIGFHTKDDGQLYCDKVQIADVRQKIPDSQFYLYSSNKLYSNFEDLQMAMEGLDSVIACDVKYGDNMVILKMLANRGSGAILDSESCLLIAEKLGFQMSRIVFDGRGKLCGELELAIQKGVLMSVENQIDLQNIAAAAEKLNKKIEVVLRITKDDEEDSDYYSNEDETEPEEEVQEDVIKPDFFALLNFIKIHPLLNLAGVHLDMGYKFSERGFFEKEILEMCNLIEGAICQQGFSPNYFIIEGIQCVYCDCCGEKLPTFMDQIDTVYQDLKNLELTIFIAPGPLMVDSACALVNTVTGVRAIGGQDYIDLNRQTLKRFNGTPSEIGSAFIIGGRKIPIKNMRLAEYLIDGLELKLIGRAETLDGHFKTYYEGLLEGNQKVFFEKWFIITMIIRLCATLRQQNHIYITIAITAGLRLRSPPHPPSSTIPIILALWLLCVIIFYYS